MEETIIREDYIPLYLLRFSDNKRHYNIFKQLLSDGVAINGTLDNEDNFPALRITAKGLKIPHFVWLFPEFERFMWNYLSTGESQNIPAYLRDYELFSCRSKDDYIDRHIKRELERGKYTATREMQGGIGGIRLVGKYPYGQIDYGFFPYSLEVLAGRLKNVEPFRLNLSEKDIPELHHTSLPIECRDLNEGEHLDSIFEEIPSNTIIDKTICGCGATWLEIHAKRHSIIVEPNVPVIIGKTQQHSEIIGVYGDALKPKKIAERIKKQKGYIKIMTTPDSYQKVVRALKELGIDGYKDYFLLFDECEKIVSDIDYRPNVALPIDDFFKFENKAMVSATPIVANDPRFEQQGFKVIKIRPRFEYRRLLEFKPTNDVKVMFKRTIEKIEEEKTVCIFYNSITGIEELIDLLNIAKQSNIYCSEKACKELKKDGYNVFHSVTGKKGEVVLNRYNFFTSRFYSAVDIKVDSQPVVIMITEIYKTVKDKMPYSLIDPETEAVQITGRFRNGVSRIIHITNTNPNLKYRERERLEQFLGEEHTGLNKLKDLYNLTEKEGEKHIIQEAIENTAYWREGYVDRKRGEVNYFRYNNAFLDERLKMIYRFPAPLYKAYTRSGAFDVIARSEYVIFTEEERQMLKNKNTPKVERITLLYEVIKRLMDSESHLDHLFEEELKTDYSLYIEAFASIGFQKVKELGCVDSDIRAAINDVKFKKQITDKNVLRSVYSAFNENTTYSTAHIKTALKEIFHQHNLTLHRQPQGKDISFYFNAIERRTGKERGWELSEKLHK